MFTKEIAEMLNNRQYREDSEEKTKIVKLASENNMVIITGYSDDNIELSWVIKDEISAYTKTLFHIDNNLQILQSNENFLENFNWDFDYNTEELLKKLYKNYVKSQVISIEWEFDVNDYSWFIDIKEPKEDLDYSYFDLLEDWEKHTRWIVIQLK